MEKKDTEKFFQSLSEELPGIPLAPNFYTWVKDTRFRFVYCNENLARICGLDSPQQIIGKTDYDLIWKDNADSFRLKDTQILTQAAHLLNVVEKIKVVISKTHDRLLLSESDILITKAQYLNREGECVGIVGSHVDITGYLLVKKYGQIDTAGNLHLGKTFCNAYLTRRETDVLKLILQGFIAKRIAQGLGISHRTVESHTDAIKSKLQCTTKGEIIVTSVRLGLAPLLLPAQAHQ